MTHHNITTPYLSYRELLVNFEAVGLFRASLTDLDALNRTTLYDRAIARARPTCSVCKASEAKFVPFAQLSLTAFRVVRVCLACDNVDFI